MSLPRKTQNSTTCARKRYRYKKAQSVAAMPTFKIVRRPKRGPGAAGGKRKRKAAAAVPDPVVSAAAAVVPDAVVSATSAFPDPAVSSGAALTASASLEPSADGRKKKKRTPNRSDPSTTAKKKKIVSTIRWGGKQRYMYIGAFDTVLPSKPLPLMHP